MSRSEGQETGDSGQEPEVRSQKSEQDRPTSAMKPNAKTKPRRTTGQPGETRTASFKHPPQTNFPPAENLQPRSFLRLFAFFAAIPFRKTPSALPLLAALLTAFSAPAAEVLYNGIALPTPWPPQRTATEMKSLAPMPVPYLAKPPAVIPVNVGRQLFVDDFLIESTTLRRRFHRSEYHALSPVLRPEKSWETNLTTAFAAPFSDGVWWDPQERTFKLWYRAASVRTCLALSPDGLTWTRPALDVNGTNVVHKSNRDAATVWLDHDATDPAQRFKLFEARTKKSPFHLALRVSPDGRDWSDELTVSGPSWDRTTVFWNPFRQVWVASVRGHDHTLPEPVHRLRNYHEGKTATAALAWTNHTDQVARGNYTPGDLQPWVAADRLDPRHPDLRFSHHEPQLYNLDVFPYESLLVGLFTIWQGPDNETCAKLGLHKRNEVLAGFTRDGFHWDRTNRDRFLAVSDDPKAWNAGNVQSVGGGCVIVGDQLYFYCSGRTMHPSDIGSTGLATLRRDGFASLDADATGGTLTTRPLKFSGRHLFVNLAAPAGELRVEALDATGKTIAPFTAENCLPLTADKTLLEVKWRTAPDLAPLTTQPVRLRFHLRNGSLFSFWISPAATGASHGYVAAGGPGYTSNVDTVGTAALRPAPAPPRARRVLYNFDGDSCFSTKANAKGPVAVTTNDVLRLLEEIAYPGSQVDTVLVCINAQALYYPTTVGTLRGTLSTTDERAKWPPSETQRFANMKAFFDAGVDPYALLLAETKRRGREALLSFRMNDDHGNDFLRTQFGQDHPEWRLGKGALDFGRAEVRDYTVRLIEEAVRRYDCDGLELDFNRFPTFFQDGATAEQVAKLTALVHRVRTLLDDLGRERGRPLVLGVRVPSNYGRTPPTPASARLLGCDVAAWVRHGWVDFVTVAEFFHTRFDLPLQPWKAALANVPVYGGIEAVDPMGKMNTPASVMTAEKYQRAARHLWRDGADGIYLFNFFIPREKGTNAFEPPFPVLRDLGRSGN